MDIRDGAGGDFDFNFDFDFGGGLGGRGIPAAGTLMSGDLFAGTAHAVRPADVAWDRDTRDGDARLRRCADARRDRGRMAYHAGLAAEDIVETDYRRRGYLLRERRWRGPGGEIDLIFEKAGALVFVEVKKARDTATAAARISRRQIDRILASAACYLGGMPNGQDTDMQVDAALVDGRGALRILENALAY